MTWRHGDLDFLISRNPGAKWIRRQCVECNKEFARLAKYCSGGRSKGLYCSLSCSAKGRNRLRKGVPSGRSQFGADNPNWKGGVSTNHVRYKNRFAEKNPEKVAAHRAVQRAIKTGALVRQPCEHCGAAGHTDGHHEDYTKPLAVIWLCVPCHNRHHHPGKKRGAASC